MLERRRRKWPWLVVAVVLCPCNVPILLAVLGTGVVGGALARNEGVLFAAFGAIFAFALWQGLGRARRKDPCSAREDRTTNHSPALRATRRP